METLGRETGACQKQAGLGVKRGIRCPPAGGGQRAEGMPNPLPVEGTQCRGQVGCGSVVALGTSSVGGPSQLCPPDGQGMPTALQVLCSPCGAAKPWLPPAPCSAAAPAASPRTHVVLTEEE